ncbi:MAG: transcriptional repressor [Flavobacteriales bacterium]|nr:transcriptional repressor [Flavobacteriales bacterium]
MPPEAKKILASHGLRATVIRQKILEVLCRAAGALTQHQILSALSEHVDRVTFYRTLTGFEESGLVHRVVDAEGTVRFAVCRHDHAPYEEHSKSKDNHVHFHCEKCARTLCLEEVPMPRPQLPAGFNVRHANLFMRGMCADCSQTLYLD